MQLPIDGLPRVPGRGQCRLGARQSILSVLQVLGGDLFGHPQPGEILGEIDGRQLCPVEAQSFQPPLALQ